MKIINISFLTLLLVSCFASTVISQCLTDNDKKTTADAETNHKLIEGRFRFAEMAMEKISDIEPEDNIFFSPHSLYQALSLAYFGTKGTTEENLKKILGIPEELSKIDLLRYLNYEKSVEVAREKNATSNYEFKVANKMWITDQKKIKECVFDFFGSDLEKADFKSNPETVRMHINEWVSNTTKGNIKDLLPTNSLDENSDLVLANAIYFKGLWQSRFTKENTKKKVFYTAHNNAVLTTFMKQKGSFPHAVSELLGIHILEIPYKGEDISMIILLPPFVSSRSRRNQNQTIPKMNGLQQLVQRIANNFDTLKEILEDGMMPRDVEVLIPKFSIERTLPINELLHALGADDVLSQNANFGAFLEDKESKLHLGSAIHRAKIELSEEGTTAAAATALFSFRSSRPTEPTIFKADHPFVYIIYDKLAKSILFVGIFRKPEDTLHVSATV